MIPNTMEQFLRDRLPERTWRNRLVRENGMAFMEFETRDVERLSRLGIEADNLGPILVVCMWVEDSPLEIGGYLVVDNLAMGKPAMGGIRMLPDITPGAVHNLARGMTLKNAAAQLPYGGGKSGIVAQNVPGDEGHQEIVRGFAHLIHRYHQIYLPGPDVGTNDQDMKTIAIEIGLDNALSKPVDMGGNRIDELGAAAGGVIIALESLRSLLPQLDGLPQFDNPTPPSEEEFSVLIQGFGAVGAHAARILKERHPDSKVIGISDVSGYLYSQSGLPVHRLFDLWESEGQVAKNYFLRTLDGEEILESPSKFSTWPDDLLRECAFCLIPAAPIANYLDTESETNPCITVDRMGSWSLIVEGANTYSPDPQRKAARARMERSVYRQQGVLIATDYLVNSGGVIFAAQEHLIKTPDHLRIPDSALGNREAVEAWLNEHQQELQELANQRRVAAQEYRDRIIRRNMEELINLLSKDADMLPSEAAERISVRRIASRERDRTAADIMEPIQQASSELSLQEAARQLVECGSTLLAVASPEGKLVGVLTEWDITQAMAQGFDENAPLQEAMTTEIIKADPQDGILEVVRKLEHFEISAMPVVQEERAIGLVSSDLLARRSLLRLLQADVD